LINSAHSLIHIGIVQAHVKVLQMLVFKVQKESQLATCSNKVCNTTLKVFFIFHFVWVYNVKSTHFVNLNFSLYVYLNWLFVCKLQCVGGIWVTRAWWWRFITKSWCFFYPLTFFALSFFLSFSFMYLSQALNLLLYNYVKW